MFFHGSPGEVDQSQRQMREMFAAIKLSNKYPKIGSRKAERDFRNG
jgi:hypothetical protein